MYKYKIDKIKEFKFEFNVEEAFLAEEEDDFTFVEEGEIAFGQLVEANVPRAMKFAYETWQKNKFGVNDLEDYQQSVLNQSLARAYDAYNLIVLVDFKGILDNMMLYGFPSKQNSVVKGLKEEVYDKSV